MRSTVTDNTKSSRKKTDSPDSSRRMLLASSLRSISTLYLAPATLMLLTAKRATAQSVTPASYTVTVEVLVNDWDISWVNENNTQQRHTFRTTDSGSRITVLANTRICWSTSGPQPSIQYGNEQRYAASGCFDVIQSSGITLLLAQHP